MIWKDMCCCLDKNIIYILELLEVLRNIQQTKPLLLACIFGALKSACFHSTFQSLWGWRKEVTVIQNG